MDNGPFDSVALNLKLNKDWAWENVSGSETDYISQWKTARFFSDLEKKTHVINALHTYEY